MATCVLPLLVVSIREGTQDQYFAGLNFSDVSQPNKHINIHFYISRLRNPPSFYKNVNIDRPGEVVEVRGGAEIEVAVGIPFPTLVNKPHPVRG